MSVSTLKPLHALEPAQAHAPAADLPLETHPSLLGINWVLKRSIDVVGAAVGLVLLAPVLLLVAFAIRLDSRGPIIFRQKRVGLNGREFYMYKFRSMANDAEARKQDLLALNEVKDGPIFKMALDPRVTRVGRFIRKTSIDEFPQLVNVLFGQMSLVGPRPPVPEEVKQYSPREWERLSVMPGATGLWQVSGRSDLGSFRKMVQLDLEYISSWSVVGDISIIFRTVPAILKMEGSC